jgi:lipid-A-disaccharide synthase
MIRTQHVGLPNVLLARRAFPELLQREVTSKRLAATLSQLLDHPEEARAACAEIRAVFGDKRHPSREVAAMLQELLH